MPECDTDVLWARKDFFLPCKFFSNGPLIYPHFYHLLLMMGWGSFRAFGLVS